MLPELHSILNLLEGGFSQLKVLVVGDIMLDRYIHGEVERISPRPRFRSSATLSGTSAPAEPPM
ncbi:hypothetical protein [Tunturiibacter gelidiferens]|uniref:hypothetical protein n=1 Tax=Tunturiibacter gelidiferens TaxID=3069689 RepID=UPI003D9BA4F0